MIHTFLSGLGKKNSSFVFASYYVRKSYSELNFLLKKLPAYISIFPGVEYMGGGGVSKIKMFSIKVEMSVHFLAQHCQKYALFEKKVN